MIKPIWILFLFSTLLLANYSFAEEEAAPLSSAFDNPGNLTDKEMDDAKNFKHQGYRERKRDEACRKNQVNCDPNSADPGGLLGALEQHMGKAYSMIFGGLSFIGGGPKTQMKGQSKDEKSDDYCMYGAMGWEMIAMLTQQDLQGNIAAETAKIQDIQLRALVSLKKDHEARVRTATMQSVAYGAVSLCYTGYAVAGGYTDPWLWAKGLSAVLLTGLYVNKASRHGEAARAVQSVIDGLPKAGDCNPWTGGTCFCSEASSQTLYPAEYQHTCLSKLGPNDIASGNVGCGAMNNGKMTYDKQCKCRQTNTCFIAPVKAFNPKFNIGSNIINTANRGSDLLAAGEFDHAKLTEYSTEARALALNNLTKMKPNLPTPQLNDEQKAYAAELAQTFPASFAAVAAAAPVGNSPVGLGIGNKASELDKLPPADKKKLAEAIKANYASNGGSDNNARQDDRPKFTMPSFGEKEVPDNSPEVLSFAEKAMNNADVSNAPQTPIFDIISNRYRMSGWKKVESTEMKPQ